MCACFSIELKLVYLQVSHACLPACLANNLAAIPRTNTSELSQSLTDDLIVLHCFPW